MDLHQGANNNSSVKKNYILHALKNFKIVKSELDMMENCEEYQYKNSLNMFSLTLGPFEIPAKNIKGATINRAANNGSTNPLSNPAMKRSEVEGVDDNEVS